ncbi:MAG TPA: myo-inosose-2 dehydratase [Steroidobacteraceae bacterium]|nr:myo-inosose-2 dehydratase [Steroidobacteraceae bacterium]
MSVRIGINPLTWTIDDLPEVGGETSLETCLAEARAAGFEGVELGCKFPRTAPELKNALAPHGLALVSGWYSANLLGRDAAEEFEAMRPHRELLSALGCDVVVVAETTRCIHGERDTRLSQRPVLAPSDWPRFAERLDELGSRLRDSGLALAYHHHMGTVVQTEDEVDRLMDSCDDAVSLLLDTGHLTFAGGDPVRTAARHVARIAHVHCKDVRRAVLTHCLNRDSSFLDAVLDGVFTVPGDGCVDYPAVLAPIARAGYAGWLVVEAEQDPAVAPSAEYANLGYRNLRRFADSHTFA